ncbi:hypothetical protein JTB14_002286 [Gonioctena quinquepunctata]|nr:hypothetical protein JTB14_002286 [Gonioctena quinquepunctata]
MDTRHVGIRGNEEADSAAKMGSDKHETDANFIKPTDLNLYFKKCIRDKWEQECLTIDTHLDTIRNNTLPKKPPKPTKIVGQNPRDRSEAISESEKRKKAASSSEDELSLSTHDDSSTSQGKITKKKRMAKRQAQNGRSMTNCDLSVITICDILIILAIIYFDYTIQLQLTMYSTPPNIIQWNCNGLQLHLPEIQLIKSRCNPTAFILQETHLRPEQSFRLRGFTSFRKDLNPDGRAKGGVAIFLRDSIHAQRN